MSRTAGTIRRSSVLATAAAVAVAAFLAGSRQEAPAQGVDPPTPVDPCRLITESEAEVALAHPVVKVEGGASCTYTVTTPGAFSALTVSLGPDELRSTEESEAGQDTFAESMRLYAESAGASLHAAVAGDEAWATLSDPASQVIARSGDRFVTVTFVHVTTPEAKRLADLQDLAQRAISRLG